MLDLRRLDLLHRYAAAGSIAAVAAQVGYSASAVSQQLAALEREAGTALIERTARSSRLTDAGRELADHAASILAAVETAEARLKERAASVSGVVRLFCLPGLAPRLAPHLAAVQESHPDLRVIARESGSRAGSDAVADARCDIAVVDDWDGEGDAAAGLTASTVATERIVLAVPGAHPLVASREPGSRLGSRRLTEVVARATWLCAPVGELSRIAGDRLLEQLDAQPRQQWEFEGLSVLSAVVASGGGVALLPLGNAREHPSVATYGLPWAMRRRIVTLTRIGNRPDPAVRVCLAAVATALSG